jgi:WS/DGAT C-terminal domain
MLDRIHRRVAHRHAPSITAVSFDLSPQRISGNYLTGVLMPIPVQADTPLDRVREAHDCAVTAKESNHLIGPEVVARWSNFMPPAGDGGAVQVAVEP